MPTSFDTKVGNLVEKMYTTHAATIRDECVPAIMEALETKQSMDKQTKKINKKYTAKMTGIEDLTRPLRNFLRGEQKKLKATAKLTRTSPLFERFGETHLELVFGNKQAAKVENVRARILELIEQPERDYIALGAERANALKRVQKSVRGGVNYKRLGDIVKGLGISSGLTIEQQAITIFESFEHGETQSYDAKVHNLRFFLEGLDHWDLFKVRQQLKYGLWKLDEATTEGVDKMVVVKTMANMETFENYGKKKKVGKKLSAAYRAEARNDEEFAVIVAEVFPVDVEANDD